MARILIVDDSEFTRDMLRRFLLEAGYSDLILSASGKEAIKIVEKDHPDVVLLDISMEEGDGIQALTAIKGVSPKTKIIMITAVADEVIKKKVISEIADGYIIKPFKKDNLLRIIEIATKGL